MKKLIAGIVIAAMAAFGAHAETALQKAQREWQERLTAFYKKALGVATIRKRLTLWRRRFQPCRMRSKSAGGAPKGRSSRRN